MSRLLVSRHVHVMRLWPLVALLLACQPSLSSLEVTGDVFTTRAPTEMTDGGLPCTPSSQRADWPVRVVFVVQQSGGMCVADPPGSTGMSSDFCSSLQLPNTPAVPARVRVMLEFLDQHANKPNVSYAVVTYGLFGTKQPFVPVGDAAGRQFISSLPTKLTSGAGLAHALGETSLLIETDVLETPVTLRSRTRYVVVVLGTGFPTPRCARNDSLVTYASPTNPDALWADTASFCNSVPPEFLGPFSAGSDLNQNAQIFGAVDSIVRLDSLYGLGDVKVHTRVVLSDSAVTACGGICASLFDNYRLADARSIARWTAGNMAQRGLGTFVDPGEPSALTFSGIDTSEFTTFCD